MRNEDYITARPTRFIGRREALERLRRHVAEHRLVTVHGPPGVGKTRAALELVARLEGDDATEVVFCALARAESAGEMIERVAQELELPAPGGDATRAEQLSAALASRSHLLLLDNFEQLEAEAALQLQEWLDEAPSLRILVTSRSPLRLPEEAVFEWKPLTPDEATELFVDRARLARTDFVVGPEVRSAIDELVHRLDRLPLAVELAAARVGLFPPVEMLARLDQRFRMLRPGNRPGPGRNVALETTIEWSWNLLDDAERTAISQLLACADSFSLAAAEAVVEVDGHFAAELVESLRDHAFLRDEFPVELPGEIRFAFYESIRAFVADRTESISAASSRHAAHFLEHGERLVGLLTTSDAPEASKRLVVETPNIELVWERHVRDVEGANGASPGVAARAAIVLDEVYRNVGRPEQHEAVLSSVLALSEEHAPTLRRRLGELHLALGELESAESDFRFALGELADGPERQLARVRLAETLRLAGRPEAALEALDLDTFVAPGSRRLALAYASTFHAERHDLEAARAAIEEIRSLEPSADLRYECEVHRRQAYTQYYLRNYGEQRRVNELALELARTLGDRKLAAIATQGMGDGLLATDDFEEAVRVYGEALELHRDLGNRRHEAILQGNLAGALHRLDELPEARRHYADALAAHRRSGADAYEAVVLFGLGTLEFEEGQVDDARLYFDRALQLAEAMDNMWDAGALHLCHAWLDGVESRFERASSHVESARDWFVEDAASWPSVVEATAAFLAALTDEVEVARELVEAARDSLRPARHATEHCLVDLLELAVEMPHDAAPGARRSWLGDRLAMVAANHHPPDRASVVTRRLHARIVRTALTRVAHRGAPPLEPAPEPPADQTLVVGPEGSWFVAPDGGEMDLRRRKSIRLILEHLVELHFEGAGEASDVHELFEIGWPGETVAPDTAAERVYWAIRTLRKNGLDELIVTTDEGYMLDPELDVVRGE